MLAQSEFEIKQLVTDRVSKGVFRHLQKKKQEDRFGNMHVVQDPFNHTRKASSHHAP